MPEGIDPQEELNITRLGLICPLSNRTAVQESGHRIRFLMAKPKQANITGIPQSGCVLM